jgi:hypothetical protein
MSQVNPRRLPSPAIVAQDAVRRFPRWALVALCTAYALAGFAGREPWKNADIVGFAQLFDVLGASETAWILVRSLAAVLLGLICISTWYATYYLARRDAAQPVPFAFGGEAKPTDYARAIADGALLALIACLGLAQLGHETTSALLQTALISLGFFSLAAYQYHPIKALMAAAIAIAGLIFTMRGWMFEPSQWLSFNAWKSSLYMMVWFAWPAWVLATLAVIKWRRHWFSRRPTPHIAIPMGIVLAHVMVLPIAMQQDRWFLGALPALATLAAFALPTLRRAMKSLIDLFTLLFFSGCAFVIWVVWIAMQTGVPPQPAANVARLLPAFIPTFSAPVMLLALAATMAWGLLVYWRLGKHRPAIWMSMVLPAGGAALCWALLMSLWMPLLDHARSYKPLMTLVQKHISAPSHQCVSVHGLRPAQHAALRYYTGHPLVQANRDDTCEWLVVDGDAATNLTEYVTTKHWQLKATIRRPSDKNEDWLIYRRKANAQN